MVIFRRPEGKPGYHQAEGVDDAIRFVEMLRNQEQVTDARIFRMDEVPFEFRTVFKVEIVAQDGAAKKPQKTQAPAPEVDGVVPDDLPTPAEAAASARARAGRFHR